MIKAKEKFIPNNFTVFSAAAGDQTSKPLEEAKHRTTKSTVTSVLILSNF